jgi:GMP synthase (glutamine-hydrolysing)
MILVVSCLLSENFAQGFEQSMAWSLEGCGVATRVVRWTGLQDLGDPSDYSHLIISGSEASVTEEQVWDQALGGLVRQFVAAHKPVLGICYGHQFLARILAGPAHVRRAAKPEVGFLELPLSPNPLFRGLDQPLVMVTHNDEAFDLPDEFKVLASSPDCSVHAFQYRDLPVWGTQFHPECDARHGDQIWRELFSSAPEQIPPPPRHPERLEQNRKLFRNFVAAGKPTPE